MSWLLCEAAAAQGEAAAAQGEDAVERFDGEAAGGEGEGANLPCTGSRWALRFAWLCTLE